MDSFLYWNEITCLLLSYDWGKEVIILCSSSWRLQSGRQKVQLFFRNSSPSSQLSELVLCSLQEKMIQDPYFSTHTQKSPQKSKENHFFMSFVDFSLHLYGARQINSQLFQLGITKLFGYQTMAFTLLFLDINRILTCF